MRQALYLKCLSLCWIARLTAVFAAGGLPVEAACGQVWQGWPDPVANHVIPYQNSELTHGP